MEHRRLKTSAPPALLRVVETKYGHFLDAHTQCSQHVICPAKKGTKTETIVETEIHL